MVTTIFWIVVALSCAYASLFGGRDGRCASLMICLAAITSAAVQSSTSQWASLNIATLAIDSTLLLGLIRLMAASRRYWPVWMSASQMLTVLTHVATTLTYGFKPNIYAGLATIWVIPCLGSMVVGIALDSMRRPGSDRSRTER